MAIQRSGAAALFLENRRCCELPFVRNVEVTYNETLDHTRYTGEIGQDKWVLEKVFPGVTDGYFVDVGSGHGTIGSNSLGLELRGWTGSASTRFRSTWKAARARVQGGRLQQGRSVMSFSTAGGLERHH